ncbi:MAG: DUF6495 family protein [Cryomorphaceae bacterium]|nr:DUF6495 family protein [Flavobacteriales bacterium]
MKYRKLHPEELDALKEDFVQFLAANSITAPDWVKLRDNDAETAGKLVEMFSEIVWEKVLDKVKYLEIRTKNRLAVMQFGDEKAEMVSVAINDTHFDFKDPGFMDSLADGKVDWSAWKPEVHTGSKKYKLSRKEEVFYEMERGAKPCKAVQWAAVKALVKTEKG